MHEWPKRESENATKNNDKKKKRESTTARNKDHDNEMNARNGSRMTTGAQLFQHCTKQRTNPLREWQIVVSMIAKTIFRIWRRCYSLSYLVVVTVCRI